MTVRANPTDLLIAPPSIPDARFRNSVIMLTHTTDQGSFGLCVNRPLEHTIQDLMLTVDVIIDPEVNWPLYWGGPVSPTTVWMLHSSDWYLEEATQEIDHQWSMTSNIRMFELLAQGDIPQQFRIVCGYCAWAADQLERELEGLDPWQSKHSWLVANNLGPEWLFEQPVEELWSNSTTVSAHQAVASWL